MIAGIAVSDALKANAAVAALVVARVFPSQAPQGTPAPYIVFQLISDVPESTVDGSAAGRLTNARLQVDCYGSTYVSAHAVATAADAVVSALSSPDLSAWRIGKRDLFDDKTQQHRVSMDFAVWHEG